MLLLFLYVPNDQVQLRLRWDEDARYEFAGILS
jgi:hypothetical protein